MTARQRFRVGIERVSQGHSLSYIAERAGSGVARLLRTFGLRSIGTPPGHVPFAYSFNKSLLLLIVFGLSPGEFL